MYKATVTYRKGGEVLVTCISYISTIPILFIVSE